MGNIRLKTAIDKDEEQQAEQFGAVARILAGYCHGCKICAYADRKSDSAFGKVMRWHRTWCPAWAAHTRV